MKHILSVTAILVIMFFLSQVLGLAVLNEYIDPVKSVEAGKTEFKEIKIAGTEFERPQVEESFSIVYIISAIIIGTILILLIIKFQKPIIWKVWFFFAVFFCLSISFGAFVPSAVAAIAGFIFAYFKIFRPQILVHNFTELFVYSGLATIFVPIMNLFAVFVLLAAISLYDMYAVWKSKHMIKLAKFQAETNVFAGLLIPYSTKQKKITFAKPTKAKKGKKATLSNAILGGGDIGFPLFFTGVVFKTYGLTEAALIIPFTTASLALLFFMAKKDRFYPAMPFLAAGCVVGFGFMKLIL